MLVKETKQTAEKIFLNFKDGKVVKRNNYEEEEHYSEVVGEVTGINLARRTFRGEQVSYWYLNLSDVADNYAVGFAYSNNLFKSIILQLASVEGLEAIKRGEQLRFVPYQRGGYDKVQIYAGEIKLSWNKEQLPPLKEVNTGAKVVKDDTERMDFIISLVDSINEVLKK